MPNPLAQTIPILFRDKHIAVVDKPGGLLAVPGRGPEKQDCVATRLRAQIPEMIEQPAVHRLDMATSGLMVFAVDRQSHAHLSKQFADRTVQKRYVALVEGVVEGNSGEIRLRFRLDPNNRPLQIYDPEQGKLGITKWRLVLVSGGRSRIEFMPVTGRTHQLRVHAAHEKGLGTPIVGDYLYGRGNDGDQMMLHASHLRFTHPATEKVVMFESPTPF